MDLALLFFVFLNVCAAMSGGYFTPGEWYEALSKPSWQPPKWAFPVVWSVLYLLNAISGWIIWKTVGLEETGLLALAVYIASLVLNALWSAIFFGMRRMRLALLEAGALWASVAAQIYLFWQIDSLVGMILLPYLLWVSVAFWLNRTMLRLNPKFA